MKRKIITVLIVIVALAIVSGIILLILNQYENKNDINKTTSEETKEVIGMYGSTASYIFYPIDDDLDPEKYPEYQELDRDIHYTFGAETVVFDFDKAEVFGQDVKILADYLQYAIDGDSDSLNALFSDNYYSKYDPYYSFTKQMIYDIELKKIGEETVDDNTYYMYDVSYKIYRNNGTFRNDFGQDSYRTLYFRILESDGTLVIDNVEYYQN